jgi:hypothetical protein
MQVCRCIFLEKMDLFVVFLAVYLCIRHGYFSNPLRYHHVSTSLLSNTFLLLSYCVSCMSVVKFYHFQKLAEYLGILREK